jgi:feruloyl-CoA synthase
VVGILAFLNLGGCRQFVGDPNATLKELSLSAKIREAVRAGLEAYNRRVSGSSRRIARALLLDDVPSVEANEITDKAYINQRRVLERRSEVVERLFDDHNDATIIVVKADIAA